MAVNIKPLFDKLRDDAKQFDKLYTELNRKLSLVGSLEPASVLDKLNKQVPERLALMEPELAALKKRNRNQEKTLNLLRTVVQQKKKIIADVSAKIAEFTVDDSHAQSVTTETKPAPHLPLQAEKEKKSAVNNTSKQQRAVAQIPLKSIENVAEAVQVEKDEGEKTTPCSTPARSCQAPDIPPSTPKLADYLSLDVMYDMLEGDKLITKSSKKSSTKKVFSVAKGAHGDTYEVGRSCVKSRKALVLSTPGKHGAGDRIPVTPVCLTQSSMGCQRLQKTPATSNKMALDKAPSTPVVPQLVDVPKLDFSKIPKPDFNGRIAMIDVEEFHTKVEEYIKKLLPLELINSAVNNVDLMFKLTPEEPVKKEDLLKLVTPIVGPKAKLCLNLLVNLKRLKSLGGGEELIAVYGKPS